MEDYHFYIDHAPPEEVKQILRVLSQTESIPPAEMKARLLQEFDFHMQKDFNYSPKRLYDLGLLIGEKKDKTTHYRLNELGNKVKSILSFDEAFYDEIIHFLHYDAWTRIPICRKLFWSYRTCCDMVWEAKAKVKPQEIASRIQSLMIDEFPTILQASTEKAGARFNSSAVNEAYSWLKKLEPKIFGETTTDFHLRFINKTELILLSLSLYYENSNYSYGDPVIINDSLIDMISKPFFLDQECTRNLINQAERLSGKLKLFDTFAGSTLTMNTPYHVIDLK